jgi:hypothetical protein
MKKGTDIQLVERRDFIKKAGLGVGAVGAVAIGLPKTSAAAAPGGGEEPGSSGYRETKHVRTYYDLARY